MLQMPHQKKKFCLKIDLGLTGPINAGMQPYWACTLLNILSWKLCLLRTLESFEFPFPFRNNVCMLHIHHHQFLISLWSLVSQIVIPKDTTMFFLSFFICAHFSFFFQIYLSYFVTFNYFVYWFKLHLMMIAWNQHQHHQIPQENFEH